MSQIMYTLRAPITSDDFAEFIGKVCTSELALLLLAVGSISAPMFFIK